MLRKVSTQFPKTKYSQSQLSDILSTFCEKLIQKNPNSNTFNYNLPEKIKSIFKNITLYKIIRSQIVIQQYKTIMLIYKNSVKVNKYISVASSLLSFHNELCEKIAKSKNNNQTENGKKHRMNWPLNEFTGSNVVEWR